MKRMNRFCYRAAGGLAASAIAAPAFGQSLLDACAHTNVPPTSYAVSSLTPLPPFALAQDSRPAQEKPAPDPARNAPAPQREEEPQSEFHYREISDFYNIREAYSNVEQGEWEFETSFEWETTSKEKDQYGPGFSLKYGFTDTFHIELEVLPLILGQGGDQGNGDIALILFKEWWKENDVIPAFGTWIEGRFPTGDGSSGVDGSLHFNFTKQLLPDFRGHLEGFIETANGAPGGDDENRRDFQWGVGPGFDYSFSPDTIVALNYLNRSSDEFGHHNENILELGLAQRVASNQHLKLAFDIGVDGQDSTPNLGAKLLWSIEWK